MKNHWTFLNRDCQNENEASILNNELLIICWTCQPLSASGAELLLCPLPEMPFLGSFLPGHPPTHLSGPSSNVPCSGEASPRPGQCYCSCLRDSTNVCMHLMTLFSLHCNWCLSPQVERQVPPGEGTMSFFGEEWEGGRDWHPAQCRAHKNSKQVLLVE